MIVRNVLFYLGLIPVTILCTMAALPLFFTSFKIRYWIITRWSYFFIGCAKWICGLKFQVSGVENLPKQNAIVFCNHQSAWETIFMQILLPPQSLVLKRELLFIPVFGWGLALIEPIAIHRKQFHSIKVLIKQGSRHLKAGRWVVIFPEGTRVAPNENRRYTRSGAALAEATQYPVVPIGHNAGLFWPKGFWIKKSGTIQVVIGPPIDPKGKSSSEINEIAETWIKTTVKEISSL